MSLVPTIDISDPSTTSLEQVDAACRDHGFFFLEGHGLDDLMAEMWEQTEDFFDSPTSILEGCRRTGESPFGYNDRELTKQKRDAKEVFDFGSSDEGRATALNKWPGAMPEFQAKMEEFHQVMGDLALYTMGLLHDVLDLSPEAAKIMTGSPNRSAVRLNHYPVGDPVPEGQRQGLAGLGATALGDHTDPGVITLLLQDSIGGLQARTRKGDWIDVEPQPGTIVVNLGDVMQVWTNDQYMAAVHRVATMTTDRRFSIPLFFSPVRGARIEPLSELCDGPAHYRPFPWRQFMAARNSDNVQDGGTADTQISDYLI